MEQEDYDKTRIKLKELLLELVKQAKKEGIAEANKDISISKKFVIEYELQRERTSELIRNIIN